jgi:6-phospho-3-hexuloisomerase
MNSKMVSGVSFRVPAPPFGCGTTKLVEKKCLSDLILFVPASVYLGTADVVPSVQPMGNLFEQALLITFDMIIMILRDRQGITLEEMEKMHRNLE